MIPRLLNNSKEKLFLLFVVLLPVILIYLYLSNLQENFKSVQRSRERCLSELSSVKYQLNAVTEYKNRIDKLLMESQRTHQADKAIFKDMMESCVAMKQQSVICQSQFEDLQGECKKVKEQFEKAMNTEAKLKTAL